MELSDSSADFYRALKEMIQTRELVSPGLEQLLIALIRRGYITVDQSNALLKLANDSDKE